MKIFQAVNGLIQKITEKTKLSKKLLLIAVLFVSGIAALALSELPSFKADESETLTEAVTGVDTQEYVKKLEERLVSIVSSIEGAGYTKVMITLESGSEDVYLYNSDYGENQKSGEESDYEQKKEYVVVEDSRGEGGIVVMVEEPMVRGVAVVCEGADSQSVKQQIIQTVTALFNISSARVSVAKHTQ